jgi:hypothetical protein
MQTDNSKQQAESVGRAVGRDRHVWLLQVRRHSRGGLVGMHGVAAGVAGVDGSLMEEGVDGVGAGSRFSGYMYWGMGMGMDWVDEIDQGITGLVASRLHLLTLSPAHPREDSPHKLLRARRRPYPHQGTFHYINIPRLHY